MLRGYFTEGAAIGLPEEVERLAVEAGLDARRGRSRCWRPTPMAPTCAPTRPTPSGSGATGVPFFVFDGRYAVGGAQPPDVMLDVLQRCWQERTPGVEVLATGDDACGPDGCEV